MKNITKITELMQAKESVKSISTISKEGKLHVIIAGSIIPIDQDTIAIAEIFMKTTSANLQETGKAAVLVTKGMESYLLNVSTVSRDTSGPLYENFKAQFAAMNMVPKAVWTLSVDEIFDESASPNAGEKLF